MIELLTLCLIAILATLVWLKVIPLNLWQKIAPLLIVLACLVAIIFPDPVQTFDTNSGSIAVAQSRVEQDKEPTKNYNTTAPTLLSTPLSPVHFEHVRFTDHRSTTPTRAGSAMSILSRFAPPPCASWRNSRKT